MIRLLEEYDGGGLRESHYSRTIQSHLCAYGTEFDFCRFYEIFRRKRIGIVCVFNGTAAADFCEGARVSAAVRRELSEFVDFQSPNVVELPPELAFKRGFSGYDGVRRRFYKIPAGEDSEGLTEPQPSAVYELLGAPQEGYGLWLTDIMRRKNRSQLWLLGYESAALCVRFAQGGAAYITDLATPESDRKKGYATALLCKTSRLLAEKGFTAYAAARQGLYGFYEKIGCECVGEDSLFVKNTKR